MSKRARGAAESCGACLAVDDLGAGYSNLKYIADLSPEMVKLDRELISNLRQGTRQHPLVRAIVRLSEELGTKVMAEGIETEAEARAAIETGAHYGQGYFFAKPAYPPPRRGSSASSSRVHLGALVRPGATHSPAPRQARPVRAVRVAVVRAPLAASGRGGRVDIVRPPRPLDQPCAWAASCRGNPLHFLHGARESSELLGLDVACLRDDAG